MAAPSLLRAALLAAAVAVATSCTDTTAPSIEDTRFAPSLGVDLAASTRTESGLYFRDITTGTGATATAGAAASVRYSLYNTNGSRWDHNDPPKDLLTFTVVGPDGSPAMIRGFNEGVTGMRVNGRRQIIIPPHLGYGNQWYGVIPPNSILVYDVTLVSVQ